MQIGALRFDDIQFRSPFEDNYSTSRDYFFPLLNKLNLHFSKSQ